VSKPQNSNSPSAGQQPLPKLTRNGWLVKNKKWLIRVLIIIAIFGGAVIYANYQTHLSAPQNQTVNNEKLAQTEQNHNSPNIVVTGNQNTANTTVAVKTEDGSILVTAKKGQGYTHMAREALAEYLKAHTTDLTPEHKIYIEDYLQKHLTDRAGLRVGDQVVFTESAINDAISSAQALTAGQLANLHQYAIRVPSLY
jgi:hypothetical protein